MMMTDVRWKPMVEIVGNGDFLSIETYSGDFWRVADPEGADYLLPFTALTEEVGEKMMDALSKSRYISHEEGGFFHTKKIEERYKEWQKRLIKFYNYRTKVDLFQYMMRCTLVLDRNKLEFRPRHHLKMDSWRGTHLKGTDYVILSENSSYGDIGAALHVAFSRCTGPKPLHISEPKPLKED